MKQEVYIPTWLFTQLFGQTPGFYYTCASCDMFLEMHCPGSKELYYPEECSMCSFGGENVHHAAMQAEDDYYREIEERIMYGDDYEFIC